MSRNAEVTLRGGTSLDAVAVGIAQEPHAIVPASVNPFRAMNLSFHQ
jgi:hypothetical protein